ncbi:4143_t:CDS:1, partial [Scutellospora calospora]
EIKMKLTLFTLQRKKTNGLRHGLQKSPDLNIIEKFSRNVNDLKGEVDKIR